jgi:hypothetical protein
MRLIKEESGQVLVMAVLSMTLMLAFVALAVDVGLLFNAKRKVQIAADAGAVAAALEAQWGKNSPTTAAKTAAGNNGITDTANQVAVHNPPVSGYHTGSGFYEVVVNQPNRTTFLGMFLPGTIGVGARAVAGTIGADACIYVLDPSAPDALTLKGSGAILAANCGIDVNSISPQAMCITGNGNTLDTPYIRFRTPSLSTKGSCNKLPSTPYYTNATDINDPLGGLGGPDTTKTPSPCGTTISASTYTVAGNLSGTVCFTNLSGVKISGTGSLDNAGSTSPTTFVFEHGVEIATGAVVTVNSGTFVLEGANSAYKLQGSSCTGSTPNGVTMQQDSKSTLNITAPTSGTYKGISIMQPPPTTGPPMNPTQPPLEVQFGSNSGNYTGAPNNASCQTVSSCSDNQTACGTVCGIIYAPDAMVYLHDNGGGVSATGLISDTLNICSSQLSIASYNYAPGNASPLNTVALVE